MTDGSPRAKQGKPGGSLEQLIKALSDPGIYPGHPAHVAVRQTHASCVFLTESDAYKLKKPVKLEFLDYSTLRRRSFMCRREVELNRRLAPDVYLGVEPLTSGRGGALQIGGGGRVVNYLVHMRRLPDEAMLSSLLGDNAAGEPEVRRVARRIADFHATTLAVPAAFGSPSVLWRNADENLRTVRAKETALVFREMAAEVEAFTRAFLGSRRALIRERAANGRVRDGHGDLRCEHVYLYDGKLAIIDCVEFSRRFRFADVALDLAFLTMDLTASGYPDMTDILVDEYERSSGDRIGALLDYFSCYRAMVRAKVALVRAAEAEFSRREREQARAEAARDLYTALRFARGDRRPILALVSGLPGSGKTTVAGLAAQVIAARVISADRERKRLGGLGPHEHREEAYSAGLYRPEMNTRVYGALIDAASDAVARGRSVVLDATYRRRADRLAVGEVARRLGAHLVIIECTAPESVIRKRLERRLAADDAWSDATWETYLRQRNEFEPPDATERPNVVRLHSDRGSDAQLRELLSHLVRVS